VDRLHPVVFNDAWGSRVSIASLRGLSIPSPQRESELWMGAHEEGPSPLADRPGQTLADLVAADPQQALGEAALDRYGPRLPFLLKVLAPGKAISIQAHPTAEQAVTERSRTADTVYGDDWAKPELLVALAPFEVFVGMRDYPHSSEFLDRLGIARLTALAHRCASAQEPAHALLAAVLATPLSERVALTRDVVAACVRVEESGDEFGDAAAAIVRVAEEHPDDIGIVVLLLMNHRVLQPGEYIDVAAGVLHSYVRGLGIEVLANSDNVVRAGLTSKPVNVPELLRIVDPHADGVAGRPQEVRPGVEVFASASDRFVLHRVRAVDSRVRLPGEGGPRIAFCLRGGAELITPDEQVRLGAVESVFLRATERDVYLSPGGEVFAVSTPAPTAYPLAPA